MANNHFEGTGVLKLRQVTPVIKALFSGYDLDPTYPGNGSASIAMGDNLNFYPNWEDLGDDLINLCKELKLDISENNFVGIWKDVELLMKHFGVVDRPECQAFLLDIENQVSGSDEPERRWLFDLAQFLDDGHGLEYMTFEAAWYCDKLRLGEQGGVGSFDSSEFGYSSTSHFAAIAGTSIYKALIDKDYAAVGRHVYDQTNAILRGITDEQARHETARAAIRNLNVQYDGIKPHVGPSSNDEPNPMKLRMINAAREMFGGK